MSKTFIKKRIVLNSVFIVLTSMIALSCSKHNPNSKPIPNIAPNYLLTGTYDTSSGYLDYYDIGSGKYAVSLNKNFVSGSAINIPDEYNDTPVTGIMHNAFYNISASSITIPVGIETIDFEAFLYCDIESIVIPYTVSRIGDAAFYGSTVEKVTFVNSNAEDAGSACLCDTPPVLNESVRPSELATIPSFCFFNCKNLTTLSLPASIEEIAEEAFNGCSSLSSTLAFQSITTIREKAFQGCTSLRKVHISKSMFENASGVGIEPHAFNYCADKSVLEFYFYGTNAKIDTWLTNHQNWGWYSDRGNPATDKYSIKERKDGSSYFTSDWTYTVDSNTLEVTITGYNGPAPTNGYISIPDRMPKPAGNKVVKIEANVFDGIKGLIERLYLPTTLVEIGNGMFKQGFNKLYVIDDNTSCSTDHTTPPTTGRINLSGLDDLKYIGSHAFALKDKGIGTDTDPATSKTYREKITKLYLPAHLIAVGDEAFGVFGQSMLPAVNDFRWEYDSESVLETIGTDCFFALGIAGANGDIKGNDTWASHFASTLIFPKTFRHFGMTSGDKTDYNNPSKYARTFNFNLGGETPIKGDRPAHAFEGCSLLKKVIFKGGANSNDLIVPLQTFVYNESLQTIIFEERPGKYIAFHTQQGNGSNRNSYEDFAQESIGGNSGRDKNDFRGEPFLQSLFLPNKTTTLYIQHFAFHANSRGKIYLSDTYGNNMYADATRYTWTEMTTGSYDWSTSYGVDDASNGAKQWRTIGNEEWYASKHNAKYYGYCFNTSETAKNANTDSLNTFSLDQKMPVYENVHYETTIEEAYIESTNVEFGSGNPNEYTELNKCSFVCKTDTTRPAGKQNVAIMTNYLFNIRDGSNSETLRTCIIPKTVSVDETNYTVIEVGESAFSACFCNGEDTSPKVNVSSVDNVRYVKMPDTIEKIGDYAFIRAYAVEQILSYETDPASATERMPKALEHIGKNAFIFSGIKKVLKIPNVCTFYENENNNYKITSVFANAVSLRKITFIDYSAATPEEHTYSDYYLTTTYTATTGGDEYTSALYSKDSAGLSYKKDRLLLVLNRNKNDKKKESKDSSSNKDCAEYGSPVSGVTFNGLNKTKPFLFGAYKMGYWIKELTWNNNATTNAETGGTLYAQALFSGVGKNSSGDFVDTYIFLGSPITLYSSLTCDLASISGINNITKLPKYGFDGCEQLTEVNLPNQNAALPDGVFANANTTVNYKTVTPGSPHGNDAGYLDLTGTGYTKVGKESFKNNPAINTFIAPSVSSFQVGEGAFQGCANLTTVDFSNVTGTLTISKNAFNSSGVTNIIWPTNPSCKIIINDGGAFSNCKSLVSVSLPANLYKDGSTKQLGSSTFSGCTSLTTVTGTANSVDITKIGDNAFSGCTSLDNLDFDIFTSSLATIGANAFLNCKTITNSGNISLPSTITSIGNSAFSGSKIVTMVINSSTITIGSSAFSACASLTAFRFSNHNCGWGANSSAMFNDCTSLTELQLPTAYNLATAHNDTNFIKNDTNIKIYSYNKYNGQSAAENWRRTAKNQAKPVHYFVTSVSDLTSAGVISDANGGTVLIETVYFWTVNSSGEAVCLGIVRSYDGSTVTFRNDGGTTYTLTGSTFSPSIP